MAEARKGGVCCRLRRSSTTALPKAPKTGERPASGWKARTGLEDWMANVTTCGLCGKAYEASSEEIANFPPKQRRCQQCYKLHGDPRSWDERGIAPPESY